MWSHISRGVQLLSSPDVQIALLTLVFLILSNRPSGIYHVTVMMCYDKKLEASRSDFYSDLYRTRDVDCVINPRRACAARVTVLGSVCLCVCLLSHISPTERLFVLKTLSRTQRATKVKKFVGICLKRLRSRAMPRNMSEKANMLIFRLTRGRLSPLDTQ